MSDTGNRRDGQLGLSRQLTAARFILLVETVRFPVTQRAVVNAVGGGGTQVPVTTW